MTVSTTSYTPLTYAGNGSTTVFAVSWPFFSGSLVVSVISALGVESVKSITTHYTVTGGTSANGTPATGTVTMLTAPASGETLQIVRRTPQNQPTTFSNNDAFPAKTVEASIDRAILVAQESVYKADTAVAGLGTGNLVAANNLSDLSDAAEARANLGIDIGVNVQEYDADLTALAALGSTGFAVRTGSGTWSQRSLSAPATGITISNPDGATGNPTFALANDLAALEGLASTGLAVRTTTDTWAQRSLAAPAAGLAISNADGSGGNPTFALANDLAALEGLSGTNTIYYRSGTDTWSGVSIGGALSFSGGTLNVGDAELLALAGLTSAADSAPYFTGSGTAALMTVTSAARSVLDDSSTSAMLTTLGAFPTSGGTLTGATYVTPASGVAYLGAATTSNDAYLVADGKAGNNAGVIIKKGAVTRWLLTGDGSAETGSNAGSDFEIFAFDDSGASLGAGLYIQRATRNVVIPGSLSVTGTVTLSGNPSTALGAAPKQYVDAIAVGISPREAVDYKTTANVNIAGGGLANGTTHDGVVVATGKRILLNDQTSKAENGIYVIPASGAASRATDMDAWSEVPGASVLVKSGTLNASTGWTCTSAAGGTLGTTAITFVQSSAPSTVTAGTGITVSANQVSITNTGVSATTYGGATKIPSFTTNEQGQLTSAGETTLAASNTAFTPTGNIAATTVQAAIAELDSEKLAIGGAASSVAVTPTGNISSTNVQAALAELDSEKLAVGAAASGISVTPTGNIASTNVQAALAELDSEKLAVGGAASSVAFTPTGSIAATNVQSAIAEVDSEKFAIAGGTITGTTYVTPASGVAYLGAATTTNDAYLIADGKAGNNAGLNLKKGSANRWLLTSDTTAESGSNAGSNLQLLAFDDAGSTSTGTLLIERSSGNWTLPKQVTFQGKTVHSLGGAVIDATAVTQTLGVTFNLNMNGAGGGTAGSANQFGWTLHGSVTSNTGAAASYEKSVMLVEARTSDPSTDASHTRDIVAFDGRGIIAAGNTTGRAWGLYAEGTVEATADGLVCSEFAVNNEGGNQASVDTMTSKYNLHLTNLGSKNVTAGIKFSSNGALWYKGIYADSSAFATGAADTFIELQGSQPFVVKPSGRLGIGTANPGTTIHTTGTDTSIRVEGTGADFTIQSASSATVLGSFNNASPLIIVTNNTERMRISGAGQISISGLGNYANDTAAAAGGVVVNGLYRNGSVLMVRVT